MKHHWTEDEKELVRAHYLEPDGVEHLVRVLDMPKHNIIATANKMGLHRIGRRTMRSECYRRPQAPRMDLLVGRICPGRSGPCGKRLRDEIVPHQSGYIAPGLLDLVCEAGHRFIVK